MATSNPSQTVIFRQLSDVAPSLSILLQSYPAKLHFDVISGDALNGYGHSVGFVALAQVQLERCKLCGETQFTAPVFNCRGHRVEQVWFTLADSQGFDLENALEKLEPQIDAWLKEKRR
jgi:hypothetical protein